MKKRDKYIKYEDGTRIRLTEDDVPELDEKWFAKAKHGKKALEEIFGKKKAADLIAGNVTVRPIGRPKATAPKKAVSIRLDADLLAVLKASGAGWQSKANDVLRKAYKLEKR